MKTKQETIQFLESLQWKRMTKKELENTLSIFFGKKITLCEVCYANDKNTDDVCKDIDFSFIGTTAQEALASEHFIDFEIYYLKMRKRGMFLITGTEMLDYVV